MRKTLITGAVLLTLPVLCIPIFLSEVNAHNWKIWLAVGFVIAVVVLALGWIASRETFQRGDSRIARMLQRLASDDD